MAGLPGWDSLESVTRWVTFYEIAMISVLAALVGAEVLHSNYSHRKDVLIKAREEQQAADTNRDKDEAEVRRAAEVAQLQKQLADAGNKVSGLQIQNIARRLTSAQKEALVGSLAPFPGQKISI
jgi:hypothetical protein